MRFCPDCDNILIPKNKKLYCKACEKEFKIDPNNNDYNIVKTIKHDDKEAAPIVIKRSIANTKISAQDRKAFEEFFDVGDANGY
jgi:DNA-directed RNA polymerase subunit M/transcription elongation factor TFIIS